MHDSSGFIEPHSQTDVEKASEPEFTNLSERSIRQLLTLQWHRLKPRLGLRNDERVKIEVAKTGKSVVAKSPLGIHGHYLLRDPVRRGKVLITGYGKIEQPAKG
jgi:hypothetical protein